MSERRLPKGVVLALAFVTLVLVVMLGVLRASADTVGQLDVTVRGPVGGDAQDLDFSAMTYADTRDALEAEVAPAGDGLVTLPVGPAGLVPTITADDANVYYDNDKTAIAILGDTTLLGLPATMLVTAVWEDGDDESPETAVIFSFGAVSLGDIAGFDDFPLALTHSWVALSNGSHEVDPEELPDEVLVFFDDGLDDEGDTFDVSGALAFRGVIDTNGTVIGEAAAQLGLTGVVRIDGQLSADVTGLGTDDPISASAELSLTATFPTDPAGGDFPDWFEVNAAWTLNITANNGGDFSVTLGGGADITVADETYSVSASVGIAYTPASGGDPANTTFSFSAAITPPENLFGQAWLDITEFTLDAEYSTVDGFSGGLSATADLSDLTGEDGDTATIAFEFAAGSEGASGSITLTTVLSASLSDVATALGGTAPEGFDIEISNPSIYVGFETSGGATTLTIALNTNLTVQINDASIQSSLLFRLKTGGGDPLQFVFAIKPADGADDVTVGDLLGADFGDGDITLPQFTLSVSNADWDVAAADLDAPTAAYLGAGEDLAIGAGVEINSTVTVPQLLADALSEAGIDVTDPTLRLEGKLPVLGGTELGLAIAFPKFDSAPFEDAELSLFVKKPGATFEMGLEGTATLVVPKPEGDGCSGADPDTTPACFDHLVFDLTASLVIGAGSVSFDLEGGLEVEEGWVNPFGLSGLTIFELRMKLGITTTPPSVKLGMVGRMQINGNNVTVAFLLGITPLPPFINPLGFTFATNGFSMGDITQLHAAVSGEPAISTSGLPNDLRFEDVFVAFGTVDDPDLCIRSGFFLMAELHMGGTPPAPTDPPPCDPPPTTPPAATAECSATASCLASILLDINTGSGGGTPSLNAAGFFRGADLGPLHFDPLIIQLELSSSTQRLFLSGGARFDDPFDTDGPPVSTWASGSFVLDFSTTQLLLSAELNLLDGALLHVKVTGTAALSLSNPSFTLELEFRSDILDSLVNEIESGFNELSAEIDSFFGGYQDAQNNNPKIWSNLKKLLEQQGDAPPWLVTLATAMANVESTVNDINGVFTGAGLPAPNLLKTIQDIALQGITIDGFPGIPGATISSSCWLPDFIFGGCAIYVPVEPPVCLGFEVNGSCYTVPPSDPWVITGLCQDGNFQAALGGTSSDMYRVLCTHFSDEGVISELFEESLDDLGLDVPPGKTPLDVLTKLNTAFTGNGLQATCGYATVVYGAANPVSTTELTLVIHGKPVVINIPLDLVNPTALDNTDAALQLGFNALMADTTAEGTQCTTASVPTSSTAAGITLAVAPETLNEGSTVVAGGTVTVPLATSVNITWGDGQSSSAAVVAGAYVATHTYADDVGIGTATAFNILAKTNIGDAAALKRVVVNNVAPVITSAAFTDNDINEGDTAQLAVIFTDPGTIDTHVLEAVWSDGVTQTAPVSVGVRNHTFTRTIVDDNPTATATDQLTVDVSIVDKDGGSDSEADVALTIRNVDPSAFAIEGIGVLGRVAAFDTNGDLIIKEGDMVLYNVTFTDPGRDTHTIEIDWGDGTTPDERFLTAGTTASRSFTIAHQYVDDNPTDSPSDTYTVDIDILDDDTGDAADELSVTINNVDPSIDVIALSTTSHDENEVDVILDLEISDQGAYDTHVVTIDWGEGWTETTSTATVTRDASGRYIVDVSDEDARYTEFPLEALASDSTGALALVIEATNRFGDSGVFTIEVTVEDDDTGSDTDSVDLTVSNVVPTHVIHDATTDGAVTLVGGQTFVLNEREKLVLSATASDPGSDDLFFNWSMGDGTTIINEWLVGVPASGADDPTLSPHVAPRINISDSITHKYRSACLYSVQLNVLDDDDGDSGPDYVAVIVQADKVRNYERILGYSQWKSKIQKREVSAAKVRCYLDIAGYLSSLFLGPSEVAGLPHSPVNGTIDITTLDSKGVPTIFNASTSGSDRLRIEQVKFDRDLLAALMNFADGVFDWDTKVERYTTFRQLLAEVEHIRKTSTDYREIARARQRLSPLGGWTFTN